MDSFPRWVCETKGFRKSHLLQQVDIIKKCGCVCTQPCVCACFPKKMCVKRQSDSSNQSPFCQKQRNKPVVWKMILFPDKQLINPQIKNSSELKWTDNSVLNSPTSPPATSWFVCRTALFNRGHKLVRKLRGVSALFFFFSLKNYCRMNISPLEAL